MTFQIGKNILYQIIVEFNEFQFFSTGKLVNTIEIPAETVTFGNVFLLPVFLIGENTCVSGNWCCFWW